VYIKKTLIATVSALALSVIPLQASAANFKSYYDMAQKWKPAQQINFANSMIRNLERSNKTYSSFINKYSRFAGHSWYENMKNRYAFQVAEIAKFKTLLSQNSAPETTLIDTIVTTEDRSIVRRRATVVTSDVNTVEIETTAEFINEYAVNTKVLTTPVHTILFTTTTTVKVYSDGDRQRTSKNKITSNKTVDETETKVTRELIRQTAVVVEEDAPTSDVVSQVLTVEEYMARDDVDYTATEAYESAVLNMNSRINPEYINTAMQPYANNLSAIGAPEAWARGWTGKGATIAILDSGIDLDHAEFEDSIAGTKCFTRECSAGYATVQDENRVSHGTHVAGIAAGNLDGNGSTGVAYDADLLIAKTAYNSGFFDFTVVDEAIEWAVNNGADVINISANYNVDSTYKNSMTEIGEGIFRSNDTRGRNGVTFDNNGYANMYSSPAYYGDIVTAMKGNEAVLVLSAGNQGLDFAGQPSKIALDNEVGDRVLVVGNYDLRTKRLATSSNAAGTVCYDFNDTTNTCNNDNRVSDRYILAPGQYVMSADNNGEYRTNSGTSMAAPTVSGAVAVVHQMWPHMTGANLTNLLLDTASTDEILGYDENIHGQGLLDLAEATSPQGAIGIPTTGRIDGSSTSVASVSTMNIAGASISALSNMMVVDDYDRDFYMDGNNMNNGGVALASYSAMSNVTVPMENVKFNFGDMANGIEVNFDGVKVGVMNEEETFLGNVANNMMIDVDGATTAYAGYEAELTTGATTFYGSATLGVTTLNVNNNAMMKSADTMISNSATVGVRHNVGNGMFSLSADLPVAITNGNGNFEVASSVSASGDIETMQMSSSLANAARELTLGVGYDYALADNAGIGTYANFTDNAGSIAGNTSATIGVNFKVQF
jgi:subtilisin family serine protease